MRSYERAGLALTKEPAPDLKSMSKDQRRTYAVTSILKLAKIHRDFEAQAKKLDPPEKYRKLNVLVVRFMGEQAANDEKWARLVETRSPEARGMAEKNVQASIELLRPLVEEVGRLEGDSSRLAESMKNLDRQLSEEAAG